MPEDPRLVVLAAVFAAWWVASAVNQIDSGALTLRLRRHIPFGLLPLWTFFAPNPAKADSRLVWRVEGGSGWQLWQELHFGFAPARSRWLVNHRLVQNKAVTDLVNSLHRVPRSAMVGRTALLSSAYLALLGLVVAQPRPVGCTSIQFAIVNSSRSSSSRQVEVVFLSEVHDLAECPDDVC
jgi:hypothetical protein